MLLKSFGKSFHRPSHFRCSSPVRSRSGHMLTVLSCLFCWARVPSDTLIPLSLLLVLLDARPVKYTYYPFSSTDPLPAYSAATRLVPEPPWNQIPPLTFMSEFVALNKQRHRLSHTCHRSDSSCPPCYLCPITISPWLIYSNCGLSELPRQPEVVRAMGRRTRQVFVCAHKTPNTSSEYEPSFSQANICISRLRKYINPPGLGQYLRLHPLTLLSDRSLALGRSAQARLSREKPPIHTSCKTLVIPMMIPLEGPTKLFYLCGILTLCCVMALGADFVLLPPTRPSQAGVGAAAVGASNTIKFTWSGTEHIQCPLLQTFSLLRRRVQRCPFERKHMGPRIFHNCE